MHKKAITGIEVNRWKLLTAACALMALIGTLYSWAIFSEPLAVLFHRDLTAITLTYAIANFSLAAIGAVCGGFWPGCWPAALRRCDVAALPDLFTSSSILA